MKGNTDISFNRGSGPEHLAAQAAEWVARLDLGTADPAEFERWRRLSPAHALAFARAYASWEQVNPVIGAEAEPREAHAFSRRAMIRSAIAGLAVMAGGGLIAQRAYAWDRVETGVGETRKLRLPDGSLLALNTDSSVSWKVDGKTRMVRLERGEMALEVSARDIPLALEGEGLRTRLSVGQFNARLKPGELDVTVLRGEARSLGQGASPSDRQVVAGAYRSLRLTSSGPKISVASLQQVAATLAWQSGEILFQDEPLSAAVGEYNRYLDGKVLLGDPGLGAIRVGGRFTSTDPTVFFEALEASLDIEATPTNGGYLLTRKK